ncbi:hypothetical protein F5144DRAFT_583946 [Chaetomium tenue]|uniref:Uncharacterized protein n=1 Tax=Chaetomium tenue TaxID=1854479 RepID=A0ACB7P1B6_9PEZI|nr:hypothetical protein F5144DRAFT_583946 [Chaetomium globosum]
MSNPRQHPGLACEECRRRKARCDRVRPRCGICVEAGHDCVILDKRPPRGPKKGQIRELQSRLAQLERLVTQAPVEFEDTTLDASVHALLALDNGIAIDGLGTHEFTLSGNVPGSQGSHFEATDIWPGPGDMSITNTQTGPSGLTPASVGTTFYESEWYKAGLIGNDLDSLYFERVHAIIPMIHRKGYAAWAAGDDGVSPARACLRSAMRTIAAATSAGYRAMGDEMYNTTRRMLESLGVHDDNHLPWMRRSSQALGNTRPEIEHECIQAWLLLAYYDFMHKSERQALLTAGRAFRLLQLSGLFRLDPAHDASSDRATTVSEAVFAHQRGMPGGSWRETEEKRRTLWAAFILDRLSGMLNDRPWALHEELINTRLPIPEADFQTGQQPPLMGFLLDVMCETCPTDGNTGTTGCDTLSPFAECVILASLCGHSVAHRQLVKSSTFADRTPESQVFWRRHERLAAATRTRVEEHTRRINEAASRGVAPPKCDPMWAFNRVLACGASVAISDTAEANPWQTFEDSTTAMASAQLSYQSVAEVVLYLQNVPRLAFPKIHPFLPIPISLVASSLNSSITHITISSEERSNSVKVLLGFLKYMGYYNHLASTILQKLETDSAERQVG